MQASKKLLLIIIFSFLLIKLSAQGQEQGITDHDTLIPIKFNQNVEFDIGINTMQGYEPGPVSFMGNYNIFGNRFSASAGIKLLTGDTQFTLIGSYKFFKHPKISLGTGIIYNFDWLHDFSISNNFLPELYLNWKPCRFYSLNFNAAFFLKLRNVFALHDDLSYLINTTMAFSLHNDFYLPHDIQLYFEFASIERFRYMILCAPSFIFGAKYSVTEKLDLSLEAAIRYIDFFTLSAHYEDTSINVGVKYQWQ